MAERCRGWGLGRALLREALGRAGGMRIDLITRSAGYYQSIGAEPATGFRLTGETLAR